MRRSAPNRSLAYDSSDRKTFRSALCHLLQTEFPGTFGPAVTQLFAERVEGVFERFYPDRSRFKVGQVLWAAVAADDPPARGKRMEDTRLVPSCSTSSPPRTSTTRSPPACDAKPATRKSSACSAKRSSRAPC